MSLDDRIRASVDTALDDLRMRVEVDMRVLVDQLIASAAQERDEATNAARRMAFDEAWETAQRQVIEAEARGRALIDEAVARARAEDRVSAERHVAEAVSAAEARMACALVDSARETARAEAIPARLLSALRDLDRAGSLSDVFDALAGAVAREASRTAVFVVRGEHLVGWQLAGFGERDAEPKVIELAFTEGGLAGRALAGDQAIEVNATDAECASLPFANLSNGRSALAAPLVVGGRVVAVVYADNENQDAHGSPPSRAWRETTEILTRHASRCLETLTVQKSMSVASPHFRAPGAPSEGVR